MRFVVDAQLPPALARILSDHGHVAEHVFEIGIAEARDREIWRYALDHNAIIITKDEDFPDMAALSRDAPVVVWVRVGNTHRRALLQWFEPLVQTIALMIEAGDRVIELR